jgi:hypothetical protein
MHRSEWTAHIAALNSSGLSARAYARQHKLVYSQVIYWKRKLTRLAGEAASSNEFVAVRLNAQPVVAACLGTLEFPTGLRLHIHSPELLRELLPFLGVRPLS